MTHGPDAAPSSEPSRHTETTETTDLRKLTERLRADGVDVIRVSYPDMIGVDRGRDVLLGELPTALEHGLAFCRAVYHTSPMGDVVPVQGGLEAGLPDITVRPDLATVTPLPWEPNAAWCLGDAHTTAGEPAPESPRTVARRVAGAFTELGLSLACGPELEFFVCERAADGSWQRYANDLGNVYVVGRKGDPQGLLMHMLRQLRTRACRSPRPTTSSRRASSRSTWGIRASSTRPTGRSGSSPRSRRSPGTAACWPRSWPSHSTTRAGPASTCTCR